MSDNKRNGGKGYYIALILCAFALGITSYVYYRNESQPEQVSVQETYADVLVGTLETEDVPVIATQPQPTTPSGTQAATEKNQPGGKQTSPVPAPTQKQALKTMSPIPGEPIFGYSMEALSYNQTTRDWRVHNGIDLAAEAGTPVCAASDGEVYTVYEDDYLGSTVVIRHNDGYTSHYSSLSKEVSVKPGDKVTMGQTIGCVGDTAIVESALGTHVHFSVTHYDEPIDPAEFFALGQ